MNGETKGAFPANAETTISILAVVDIGQAAELERIFSHTRWRLRVVHSTRKAVEELRSAPVSVVLCEYGLPDGSWLDIVSEADRLCPRPQIIVLVPTVDARLWAEVLNCGGYDVLARPLEPKEIYRLISMAWRQWNRTAKQLPTSTQNKRPALELAKASK